MRWIYTLVWWLLLPLVLLRLWWRGQRQPEYLQHISERFGVYPRLATQAPCIWIHAVSVGETRAAEPLVAELLSRYPDTWILLTHATPTGRATAAKLFQHYGERVGSVYLPYDLPNTCARFLRHFNPTLGLLMETELWPNLVASCDDANIPVVLVNGRLSYRSARRYAKLPSLMVPMLKTLSCLAVQTQEDADRFRALGAERVSVTGNLKFDIVPPPLQLALGEVFRECVGEQRPVILAASTREGEEKPLLEAFIRHAPLDVLLVLVPRHPQRVDEVATLIENFALPMLRRSSDAAVDATIRVWLGDSMGEMFAYYRCADIALIGGSWEPLGGQNLIEACAVGCPVILGPHTFNFAQISEDAMAAGAALRVSDLDTGIKQALALLNHRSNRQKMGKAGLTFAAAHCGATRATLDLLQAWLPPAV